MLTILYFVYYYIQYLVRSYALNTAPDKYQSHNTAGFSCWAGDSTVGGDGKPAKVYHQKKIVLIAWLVTMKKI